MDQRLMDFINKDQYEELQKGINNCPKKLLGLHKISGGYVLVVYRPYAKSVKATDVSGCSRYYLKPIDDAGTFGAFFEELPFENYLLEIEYGVNDIVITEDPYSFSSEIGELDLHLFGEGKHYEIYNKLGAHPVVRNSVEGVSFAVWAPHARSVSVIGDFNMWDGRLHPMNLISSSGIYELFIPRVQPGAIYKYQVVTRSGEVLHKSDPYANCSELRPNNASVVADITNYYWQDDSWMKQRTQKARVDYLKEPINIYEVHLGSWKKHNDNDDNGFYNYRELAHELADYVVDMGYTHIELMGIAEYPFDGSWGYQVTGYYAPTRRYGTPQDFMYFIDYMHQKGISIILDWVPAHFPKDAHGLARFDGEALFEHPDSRRGEHPHWGTYIFNYGKKEVENFLLANVLFWIKQYHIDGIRVDAVASMLYLDYGKQDGEWLPNENGGRENYDAILLMQHINEVVEKDYPGVLVIAEESTAWAGVTAPVDMKGLGFHFKWNMGWMNDFLEYMKLDPYFRQFNHNRLTFSLMYAYSENFIQVLSHDEVVHGKCTLLNKMPGEDFDKFANLRTAYGFMYGHPGKKLLFMGQEFAQLREWSEARSLDWYLLQEEKHQQMQHYVKTLNKLYLKNSAFYANDAEQIGFEWIDCSDAQSSIISFIRRGNSSKDQLLFVCNFTPVEKTEFTVGVPCPGNYTEVLNSDALEFGGQGKIIGGSVHAVKKSCNGKTYSITFTLPPLSIVVFHYHYHSGKKKKR
ncbi:1,4-alpha-glucan branching protein GlgB [Anaeromicropila populeti]|uniref:1,4-alpha-glucan branching enzyme GlgB n=1 Tax=Anaeromicropila populeti TaxID=37658 RepID=A0A1I6LCL6_9FIRM|nr:1,4-alpha-glucan branching protein GlgB [Anaeromicropila populeti]SFS01028.1 1,4-alpha-glucan branching enzyme [Anaeromicropila populeti]